MRLCPVAVFITMAAIGCGELREQPLAVASDARIDASAEVAVAPEPEPSMMPSPDVDAADCGVAPGRCNDTLADRPVVEDRAVVEDRPVTEDRAVAEDRPVVVDERPACPAGETDCAGVCASLTNNREHCGACGRRCGGEEACVAGACVCAPGFTRCSGACVAPRASVTHCGACGNACSAHHGAPACADGRCAIACDAGWADCDGSAATGCEADLNTSATSCGACGVRCGASEVCLAGACVCAPGLTRCGATCVDTRASTDHCGACGQRCSATNGTSSCTAGVCRVTCAAGYADCDGDARNGCEVATSSNADHCGACGRVCMAPSGGTRACVAGSCASVCPPGFLRCNTTCVDARSSCSVGTGACRRTGSIVCSGSAGTCGVTAGSPVAEACNGVDDNCDGVTDNVSGSCTGNETGCAGSLSCTASGRVCTSNQRCPLGWTQSGSNCQMPPRSATIFSGNWRGIPTGSLVGSYTFPSYTSASGSAPVSFRLRIEQDPANCGTDTTFAAEVSCSGRHLWFLGANHFQAGTALTHFCQPGERLEVRLLTCSCDTSPFAGGCIRRIFIDSVTNAAQPPTCQSSYGQRATLQ